MNLEAVARALGAQVPDGAGIPITDLAYDSRTVTPGTLFFCVRGRTHDGHAHAGRAVEAGAAALVVEEPVALPGRRIPQLVVPNSRAAMGALAAPFFGDPSRTVAVAGVTGTNGKTTTTYLLESIFQAAGDPAGLIGTVETRVAGRATPAARTTPEAVDIQRLLRQMADAGARMCALEVTSIGIESGRTQGINFDVAVFTNLTHDHLDHHGTMEQYYAAKARLFTSPGPRVAVINADDPYGRRLAGELPYTALRVGMESEADVVATDVVADSRGSEFRAVGCGLELPLHVRLPGLFNVSNALAAACAAMKMGISPEAIASGIAGLPSVPGRFEPVDEGQGFLVVVDYAHTPDALANVLQAARGLTGGRVLAVFGCGGDRDRAKRPEMGEAAARLADVAYATSDNPRSEDPAEILKEIEAGLVAAGGIYRILADRREAIAEAVNSARAGDVVVIAGKGHETGQAIGGTVFPFDDRVVAAEVLREMRP
ncbi:MAG TPA: UDP-N-acetylmuramoyl-L-alanyl-D-glutamate--2,6-diaminopimelate ligase [Actinomycetota bacterium]|nr:UDP-N-acetylmuramoyl-L-alanyl-D-glutamate--2,6-diaminopimelate ligase [Actinomycetota bacterium]